jgi:crotonobetainyl-CoA:carnitine CoA-transferase CaiB-like acyl-CoA transferase
MSSSNATPEEALPGPLETLRVLEIGDLGEVAGKLLADAGADLIRVEPPGGARSRHVGPFVDDDPGQPSLLHASRNTSKRSVTLDVTQPAGLELWRSLVGLVDVVIDATTPTFLDDLGGGWEWAAAQAELRECVWCSISPFGRTGPRRDWAATDLVQLALGGPMMSNGYDDHSLPPIRPDGEHSIAVSNEYAVSGILAALWMRNAGYAGQLVDVSIHESLSATTEGAFPNWEYFGRLVQRQTGRHAAPVPTAPWQYLAADGEYVCLINGGLPRGVPAWSGLLDWMDEYDAADDLRDPKYQELLFSDPRAHQEERLHVANTIGNFVQSRPADEVYRRSQDLHFAWGIVRRPEQNLDDPHWTDRGFFWEGELPGVDEPVRYPGAPYRFTRSPVRMRCRPPLLGEHNHEVFVGELGITTTELRKHLQAGVV